MSGPTNFGGHQGKPSFLQTAASDEAPRSHTSIRLVAASEAEGQQGTTWGQGDVAIRGGSVWQTGVEVVQVGRARPGERRESGDVGGGHSSTTSLTRANKPQIQSRLFPIMQNRDTVGGSVNQELGEARGREDTTQQGKRRKEGEGTTESGGSVDPLEEKGKFEASARDAGGGAPSGLRRSSRAKSSWTPCPKEDRCARRRALGELSRSAELQELPPLGCYCPEECTGVDKGGCRNRAPVFATENWVHMTKGRGLDPSPQSLRAKRDIPAGTLITLFGGVTLQAWTQEELYESFTKIHAFQHDTTGEEKFQYSVMVGSEQDRSNLAWLVPVNDFKLLHRLLAKKGRASKSDRELKTLTEESKASRGLGQYAQHTCCSTHSNSHLFPIFVSREEDAEDSRRQRKNGDWMQLQGVALRSDRLIQRGEEISFGYVGSGRSGHFRRVFDCACCWCTGRCNKRTHTLEQKWLNTLEQTEIEQPLKDLREMERQLITDKGSLPALRRAFPGSTKRTRSDRKVATEMVTVWGTSGMKLPLNELYSIIDMKGWLSGTVLNELLAWILHGKTAAWGLSPHQREGVAMWSTREWDTLSRECDRYTTNPNANAWQNFKAEMRSRPAFQLPEGKHIKIVCCPVHFKSHWLWALLLLDERVGIILDPLTSHTGQKGHKEIFRKIWLWKEAVVAKIGRAHV